MTVHTGRHLFAVATPKPKPPPWTGNQALAVIDPATCPACGSATNEVEPAHQPALFWFGGYGGMTVTRRRTCTRCPWALTAAVATRTPR